MATALKDIAGQGPESVRTFINQNVVTVVVEQTLTQAESAILTDSRDAATEMRRVIQGKVRKKLTPEVESFTGRSVVASLSDHAVDPDLGVYCFVLDGPA